MESAQRFMLKGQLDKAIKDYQQVVALEPKEIRYRQKLAELLVKDSRKEEAIAQYADIGKHYADNSYFLKAIAVYKQIQRLSPGNIDIALTLASLNHKQGLVGNALAEYGQVIAQLEKDGSYKDAVGVVEQMLSIDREHVPTRLKHAELLFSSGAEDASYQAFSSLLTALRNRGDQAGVQQVSERIARLFPQRKERNLDAIAELVAAGALDEAIQSLQEWLKRDNRDMQAWQLLCNVQRRKGNRAGLKVAFSQMVGIFPDDLEVVKGAIRCDIDSGEYSSGLALLERHLPLFVERGESQAAEELLNAFPAEVAHQLKATEWLKRFCEAPGSGGSVSEPAAVVSYDDTEPPDAFAAPSGAAELPSGFGAPEAPDAPDAFAATPSAGEELSHAWEEEIQLDLDDDLDSHLPKLEEVNVPLDFPLSLDLDEPQHRAAAPEPPSPFSGEAAPFAEEAAEEPEQASSLNDLSFLSDSAPEVDAEAPLDLEDSALELTLPDDPDCFPGWSDGGEDVAQAAADAADPFADTEAAPFGEAEPVEEAEAIHDGELYEEAESFEEPQAFEAAEPIEEAEEIAEAEEFLEGEGGAAELAAASAASSPLRDWDEIYPDAAPSEAPEDIADLESHYDLGVGYKEMGMYDGAIRELDVAARNPERRLACLTLQAMCYREKGDNEKARDLLQRGLDLDVLSGDERNTLSFELAVLLETTGAVDEAVVLYRQVHKADPSFHDVGNKLYQLTGEEPLDVIDLETVDADL